MLQLFDEVFVFFRRSFDYGFASRNDDYFDFILKGRLTDGKGKTIECKKAIFIMTSNLGSEVIAEHAMQLRAEAERLLSHRLDKQATEDQEPERIEISRNFKDQVVCKIKKTANK